jgi:hypothetical protein
MSTSWAQRAANPFMRGLTPHGARAEAGADAAQLRGWLLPVRRLKCRLRRRSPQALCLVDEHMRVVALPTLGHPGASSASASAAPAERCSCARCRCAARLRLPGLGRTVFGGTRLKDHLCSEYAVCYYEKSEVF